jgi:dCTP deaminase
MVLSDVDIRRYLASGKIRISPELPPEQFGSCSVDFRLGSEFSVFEHSRHAFIDVRDKAAIQDIMRSVHVKPGDPFVLQPREFALAITEENLELDDDVLGRLEGIMPVALYPGMRICSFTFEQLSSPVSVPYYKKVGNKYAGQTQPLASRLTSETKSGE